MFVSVYSHVPCASIGEVQSLPSGPQSSALGSAGEVAGSNGDVTLVEARAMQACSIQQALVGVYAGFPRLAVCRVYVFSALGTLKFKVMFSELS